MLPTLLMNLLLHLFSPRKSVIAQAIHERHIASPKKRRQTKKGRRPARPGCLTQAGLPVLTTSTEITKGFPRASSHTICHLEVLRFQARPAGLLRTEVGRSTHARVS